MSIEFKISNQYLRSNQKTGLVSFISSISIISLALSVMTLITILSVMNGFHQELRDRVLGAISHSYITGHSGAINNWQKLLTKINQHSNVISAAPYIEKYALISTQFGSQGISVRGIKPKLEKTTSVLLDNVKFGHAQLDELGILIGAGLSAKLGVVVGDKIALLTPQPSTNIMGIKPKFKSFTVSGIFDAGINEYDNNLAFIDLHQAQLLYKMQDKVSGIRLKVDDLFNAKRITNEVLNNLDSSQYYGVDWTQQKANLIKALNLEKQMISIILSLIIVIVAFNIVSMMIMMVADRKADIAILRTLGMTPKRIVKLFFYQGVTIDIIGIVIGVILGILLALNIEYVVSGIEALLGFQFFPQDVFYIDRFPSKIHLNDIIMVVLGTLFLSVIATIYPAKRAGKLQISEVLNYE